MDRAVRLGRISGTLILGVGLILISLPSIGIVRAQTSAARESESKPAETASPAAAHASPATAAQPSAAPASSAENPPPRKLAAADAPAAPAPKTESKNPTYVIGSLDVLQIQVWNNGNLSHLYDVRPDGMISVPLVGEMKADGLTCEELKQQLTKKIGEYITDPEVTVDVAKINSKKYYIMGEGAARPGPVPLTEPITILEALASSGGFTTFANQKKIYVLRGTQKLYFNYKDVSQGKHLEQNIPIQNGDMIFIP